MTHTDQTARSAVMDAEQAEALACAVGIGRGLVYGLAIWGTVAMIWSVL
jgi:hypothetical protein